MTRSRYVSTTIPLYVERLNNYFESREAQGLGVPEVPSRPGVANKTCIADETGIVKTMFSSPELRECILTWSRKIGFSPSKSPGERYGLTGDAELKCKEKISDYLAVLRREGKKIPENPRRPSFPDWERIARESSLSVAAFANDSAARRLVAAAVAEIGLGIYVGLRDVTPTTYGDLLGEGSEWRMEELKGKPNGSQQLSNTRTQLRSFMRFAGELRRGAGYTVEDPVGPEMLEDFTSTVQAITPKIKNKDTRRKFSGEMPRWQNYYSLLIGSKGLPPKFAPALVTALLSADMSAGQLAREANVSASKLHRWLRGERAPSAESFADVRRIEQTLSLAPDTLISRVVLTRPRRVPHSAYPEYVTVGDEQIKVRGSHQVMHDLRSLLPDDYCEREADEQVEIVTWLVENLVVSGTEWSRWRRALGNLPYEMKETPVLKEELGDLIAFKRTKLVPAGMVRSGSWSKANADIFRGAFLRFTGFLTLPAQEDNSRPQGFGLDPGQLTLAMVVCEKFVDAWIRWQADRRKKGEHGVSESPEEDKGESFATSDLRFMESILALFHHETGWLTQKPELAGHLRPIPGYIDEALIERARSNWGAVCREASDRYKVLVRQLEEVVEEQRDPFEPILPLLDLDHPQYHNPISALRSFLRRIIEDMPDGSVAPLSAAIHLRNYLIARILVITALRSRNIRELTYKEDNTGHLRRVGGKWVIVIPWQSFKNKNSSFFGTKKKKHDYEKVLEDKDGLYEWIDKYLAVDRPQLMGDLTTDIFFVATKKQPVFNANSLHKIYRRLTMRYMSYNKYRGQGIPGVKPHGPHAVRDIIATFVLQQTGSYDLAGYAICDTDRTVRQHYGRFMPKDKLRLIDKLIDEAWDMSGE